MIELTKYTKPGCRPCAVLTHALNEVDFDKHGATLVEVNIATLADDELDALNLSGVPTLVARRNGVEITRKTGMMPPEEIEDIIVTAKEGR